MHLAAEKLYDILKAKSMTVATAESCTGGMIGAALTSVSGMSECYGYGVVTYANEAKEKLLGVSHTTLEAYGAVSCETACQMAQGALELSGADIAISVTGIAGPGGGTAQKPVGLVYIGIALKGAEPIAYKNNFSGSREEVRQSTVIRALELAVQALENTK